MRPWLVLITVYVVKTMLSNLCYQILLGNCTYKKTVPFVKYKMVVYMSDVIFHPEPFCLSISIAAGLSEFPDNSCYHGFILFHISFVELMA